MPEAAALWATQEVHCNSHILCALLRKIIMTMNNLSKTSLTSKAKVLVTHSYLTLCNHMDCSPSGTSVHGIPRQEYWNGLPLPSPGDLSDPEIEPKSPALQANSGLPEPGKLSKSLSPKMLQNCQLGNLFRMPHHPHYTI